MFITPVYFKHYSQTIFYFKSGLFLALLCLFIVTQPVTADTETKESVAWHFNSGPQQNQVIELFTSEGCSSCPPADEWLSELKKSPDLWTQIIPVAFHVDYWNNLGWQDPFSSYENSERQRNYRKRRLVNGVYTPGFVVNGQEWKGWFRQQAIPEPSGRDVGILVLDVVKNTDQVNFNAHFNIPSKYTNIKPPGLTLNIALLAMNEATNVPLGENRGKTLHHDFIVTDLQILPFNAEGETNTQLQWQGELDLSQCKDCAIAAWISKTNRQQPIQATGGYLQ